NFCLIFFFFSSRRRHTRWPRDWSSDVCSSDLLVVTVAARDEVAHGRDGLQNALALGRVGAKHRHLFGRQLAGLVELLVTNPDLRSEERRVGKECRSRWSSYH